MKPLSVVKNLYISEQIRLCFFPRPVFLPSVNALCLHGPEEAFHGRIVPAVPFSAHGAYYSAVPQFRLVHVAGVLAAPVGVQEQSLAGVSFLNSPIQCLHYKIRVYSVACRPSYDELLSNLVYGSSGGAPVRLVQYTNSVLENYSCDDFSKKLKPFEFSPPLLC